MARNEIGVEDARKTLGLLADAAHHHGQITILTRHRKPYAAIVPISLVPEEIPVPISIAALAAQLDAPRQDVEALVDQLLAIDDADEVIESGTGHEVILTGPAAETIREQIRSGASCYTLTVVEGEDRGTFTGWDLTDDECPIAYVNLSDAVTDWLDAQGFDDRHPDRWVLVTAPGEAPGAVNVVASRRLYLPSLVRLYETNGGSLVLARGPEAWDMGAPDRGTAGAFARDAQAWIEGVWAPSTADGHHPTTYADLTAVAEWDPHTGVRLLGRALESLGATARGYIGDL